MVIFSIYFIGFIRSLGKGYGAAMKKQLIAFILAVSSLSVAQESSLYPAQPILDSRDCILKIVAGKMSVQLNAGITAPVVRTQSNTSLKDYQDSIEQFWGIRPDVFTNVYNPIRNELFLLTEKNYYEKYKRSVYDSLAHELVHFIQKQYKQVDLNEGGDSLEMEAVEIQTWFRDNYTQSVNKDKFICPQTLQTLEK